MKVLKSIAFGTNGIQVSDAPTPTLNENEVLIHTHFTSVTTGDWRIQTKQMPKGFGTLANLLFGNTTPKKQILGTEASGIIEKVGAKITQFSVGDRVLLVRGAKLGCYSEYLCATENDLLLKIPDSVKLEEAASCAFGALTAYDYLISKAKLKPQEEVLIYGASGSVGTAALQIAKLMGAKVTAVCSEKNHALMKSLGADFVIDYNTTNILTQAKHYDVILDAVGALHFTDCKNILKPKARLLLVSGDLYDLLKAPWQNLLHSQKILAGPCKESRENLIQILNWMSEKKYNVVIDQVFSLDDINAAFEYVGQRHKKGNVVVEF